MFISEMEHTWKMLNGHPLTRLHELEEHPVRETTSHVIENVLYLV